MQVYTKGKKIISSQRHRERCGKRSVVERRVKGSGYNDHDQILTINVDEILYLMNRQKINENEILVRRGIFYMLHCLLFTIEALTPRPSPE
jgi:hypothetical protein